MTTTNRLITLLLVLTMAAPAAFAQSNLDRETKKELKQFRKNPRAYRDMIRNYEDQIEALSIENNELKEEFSKCDFSRQLFYDSIQYLNALIAEMNAAPQPTQPAQTWAGDESGVHYKVQIGVYEFFDISEYFTPPKDVTADFVDDMYYQYQIGQWSSPSTAEQFAEDVRKLGISDAFVTKWVNGERVYFDYTAWTDED